MRFIGHRGFRLRYPENTLPAFEAVCTHRHNGHSVVGIELDIHLTADDHIVVMHDTAVHDTGGKRLAVADLTFERLRHLTGSVSKERAFGVPQLHEVLSLVAHRTGLYLEIKDGSYDSDRLRGVLTSLLEDYGPRDDVFISSFSSALLRTLTPLATRLGIERGFLFSTWGQWKALPADVHDSLSTLHPHYRLCLAAPEALARLDRPLIPWTANSPASVQALLALPRAESIRAIITDDIDLSQRFPEP
jgi:glycerophosphoryl diester phosphodiesterase